MAGMDVRRRFSFLFAMVCAAALLSFGCAASTRVTPASTHIEQEIESAPLTTTTKEITGFTPDGKPITKETTVAQPGVVKQRVKGEAVGAGASATGDKLDQKIDSGAPTLNLPGVGKGSGGSTYGDFSASVAGISVFYVVGGLMILCGVASLALKQFGNTTGIWLIAGGIALAMIGLYPIVGVFILLGVLAVGTWKLLHLDKNAKSMTEALRTLWSAVKTTGTEATVAAAIPTHSEGNEPSIIADIDRKDWPNTTIPGASK
jgi:hypothetical protein